MRKKAGKIILGAEQICDALKNKRKSVVSILVADNASENTKKRLLDKCAFYNCPITFLPIDTAALGHSLGKSSLVAAIALTDENFVKLILK